MMAKNALFLIVFFILAVLVYYSSLHLPYYADDFQYVFTNPTQARFNDFFHPNPINTFYRPVQTMVLASIQSVWGWDTFVLRLLHLALHAGIATLIFRALKLWNIDVRIAFFGACYFLISQMNGAAVLGNDTVSQLLSTFFLLCTLWQFYLFKCKGRQRWRFILSNITFFLALLSKETSAALIVAIVLLSIVLSSRPRSLLRILVELTPFVVSCILYWLLRSSAGAEIPQFGDDHYRFSIGINVLVNFGLLVVQAFTPVSSVSVANLFYDKNYSLLIAIGLLSFLVGALVVYGLVKSPHRRLILTLCVLTVLSWIPVIFLGRVSEQYIYNSAAFVAVFFAIAVQYYWSQGRAILKFVIPVLALACVLNVYGIFQKADIMHRQGDNAMVLFKQVVNVGKTAPANAVVYLVQPQEKRFYYSLYVIQGFTVISWSEHLLQHAASRPDLRFFIVEEDEYMRLRRNPYDVAYTYDPATWKVYPLNNPDTARLP
jgi:4-amino-4-deoxy-L-arabinose transferase-like glycosyltransferase